MGRIQQGILGGVSGKVGNVVGCNWKGISYLRSLPTRSNSSLSEKQIYQQLKYATLMHLLQPLLPVLRIGFNAEAAGMSAFNAAVAYHHKEALSGQYPSVEIDYPKVLISQGTLAGSAAVRVEIQLAGKIRVSWDPLPVNDSGQSNDIVMVALASEENSYALTLLDAGNRADGSVTVTLPTQYIGTRFHGYVAFRNRMAALTNHTGMNTRSTSQYAGGVVLK